MIFVLLSVVNQRKIILCATNWINIAKVQKQTAQKSLFLLPQWLQKKKNILLSLRFPLKKIKKTHSVQSL